jgi:hypothetical protein
MSDTQPDPVAVAEQLTKAVNALAARTEQLARKRRQDRRLIWLTLAVAAAVVFALFQIHGNTASITDVRQTGVSFCQLTNQSRAQNKELWDYLISLSVPPPSGPERAEDLEKLAQLRAHIDSVYAPRNCGSIYQVP